ncbi:MAG: hypothetical protein WC527_00090 [Candidatus Margulisiibacteriota bacterium]
MKKILAVVWVLISLSAAASAFSLNVDPSSLVLSAGSNESISGTIILDNKGNDEISVNAYAEDWTFMPDRSKSFRKPGSAKYSCSKWITLYPDSFKLAAGASQQVKYTLTAPKDASGGYYSVIFFETQQNDPEVQKNSNIIIAGRIGTIVYFDTKGNAEKKMSAGDLKISKALPGKPMYFKMTVKNEGNTYVAPSGNIIIVDELGTLQARIDIAKRYVLQGESIVLQEKWTSSLADGQYDVIATLDFGGEAPVSLRKRITVKK